ncbi:hypothetical protein SLEP1_g5681 [Rubroshorea leprosula]|uniref:PGG domain-containing protein n=1 Tax=Rubroshorea leprosula TaxID=152421 RepID=A0AAV5HSQ4_9ROSI|nr:hypothetical protein SLEP1_g5681 [Rubroshorea leprosula]
MDDGIVKMGEAAHVGNIEGIYQLLQQDPSVLRRIEDDLPFAQTPLHIAVQHMVSDPQNDEQIRAANTRYGEFALEMMNLKPSFARKLNPSGLSPIHLAVQNNQTFVVRELLKVDKDLARVKGKGGQTPLHFAADQEALDLLVEFLEACPECITDVNIHGQTALQVAVKNGRYEAAKFLASWIYRSTHKDSAAWERAVLNGKDQEGNTVLHIAALNNDPQLLKVDRDLARVKGKGGETPLHFAADHEALDLLVEFLGSCPECITDVNIHGQTAFHVAVKNGRYEAAKLLASWICSSIHKDSTTWESVVLNGADHEGNTVLHIAALNNHPEMVRLLLKFNISKKKINLKGQTALDISEGQNNGGEIGNVLRRAKCRNASAISPCPTLVQSLRSTKLSFMKVFSRDMKRQRSKFSNDFLNALLVVYALILTTTYQACLTLPVGFTQENISGNFTQGNITNFHNNSLTEQQWPVGEGPSGINLFYSANTITFGSTVFAMIIVTVLKDSVNGMLSYFSLVLLFFCYTLGVTAISPTGSFAFAVLPALTILFLSLLILAWRLYAFKFAPYMET